MKSRIGKREKWRKLWLIVPLVIIIGVAGYPVYARYLAPAETPQEETELQTTSVRKGDIVITAVAKGNLVAATQLDLGFRAGGTVAEVAVAVGDSVTAGQVIARLDDDAARIQVRQAELSLEQAQAKLTSARQVTTQTLAIAEANANAAQAAYDALVRESGYTGDRLTAARVNLEQAVGQLDLAQAAYDTAWDPGRDWELSVKNRATALENERTAAARALAKAQDDLEVARAAYNLAVLNLDDNGTTDAARAKLLTAQQALDDARSGADVRAARWSLEQAQLALDSAQLALANTVLTTPLAGTVIAVDASAGEAVGTAPIVTLADVAGAQVRFYLEEGDLSKVAVGNPTSVVFDAVPDQTFTGAVAQIDPALVTVDGTAAIQGWTTVAWAEASIGGAGSLPVGLTAEVEITAGEAYKTLLVPVQALRELAPGTYAVFVVDAGGELKLRPVEVGLRDFANAQILSGLELGEVVSTGTVETE